LRSLANSGTLAVEAKDADVQQPIRVIVRPRDISRYREAVQELMLLFPSLRVEGCVVSGTGELFLDAVFYYLSVLLGVEHEKAWICVGLKETFIGVFEEEIELEGHSVVIRNGARRDWMGPIEEELVSTGPLIGENVVGGWLNIETTMERECLKSHMTELRECLRRHTRLLEPFCKVEILYSGIAEDLVLELVGRAGAVSAIPLTDMKMATFEMPVAESLGFETDLRVYSCGQALCSRMFCGWGRVDKKREEKLTRLYRGLNLKQCVPEKTKGPL
jgi:hypothetical protein